MYQNLVILVGYLGQDAGVHTTKTTNTSYTVLSLATKRSWKDRESGERVSETTWHKCVAWGKLADFAATLTKGMHLLIEGDIRQREYAQRGDGVHGDAIKKTVTEIRIASITKLDRPAKAVESAAATRQEVPA